ncbi:hypothetical protein CNBG_3290 [Cryptococcus deuterogattii R265]|uniref:uncharacterized protein n=1 Tax=Cryptococcus deuterogattii (strain R265) TaxID=294750 RepID=UPI001938435A|nr:hypothetical protein CNBG_3290 [Cryptococcus deuterogattii R265]
MGLFGSSDPVKETEKALAREAKAEEKNIKQSVKSLNQVEKAEAKAAKAEQQAEKHHLKASKFEEKTAGVLNKATSKHEEAYHKENIAASEVTQKQHAHSTLTHTVEQKKAQLDALQKKHQVNEQSRQSKLHEIAGPAASSGNNAGVTSQHHPSSQTDSQSAGTAVGGQNSGAGAPTTGGTGRNVGTAGHQQPGNAAGGALGHSQQGVPAGNLPAQGGGHGMAEGVSRRGSIMPNRLMLIPIPVMAG